MENAKNSDYKNKNTEKKYLNNRIFKGKKQPFKIRKRFYIRTKAQRVKKENGRKL